MRNLTLTVVILWGGLAHAIQPVETGLQPLLERHRGIQREQQKLNDLLQSATTESEARAVAYREYLSIDLEKQALECEIKKAKSLAASPLVMYATPTAESACLANFIHRPSKSTPTTTEAKR